MDGDKAGCSATASGNGGPNRRILGGRDGSPARATRKKPRLLKEILALRLVDAAPGEHKIRLRAFDVYGNMQPAPDDPFLANKVTYWESNGQITHRVLI